MNDYVEVNGYDFDGVVSIGINPSSNRDVIITGRCIDEQEYVRNILDARGITNEVYFNPMTLAERGNHTVEARTFSGKHKAKTIKELKEIGITVSRFFEDDKIQYDIIKESHNKIDIVHIVSNLVTK
jgi:hypothetical protein|tara:strand:+ start:1459 stop:1839 length:381 start_codon:yes stop_codon:yes gene_type:complete